jgi:hypothetical protein
VGVFDTISYGDYTCQTKWQLTSNTRFNEDAYYDYTSFSLYRVGDAVLAPDGDYIGIDTDLMDVVVSIVDGKVSGVTPKGLYTGHA